MYKINDYSMVQMEPSKALILLLFCTRIRKFHYLWGCC